MFHAAGPLAHGSIVKMTRSAPSTPLGSRDGKKDKLAPFPLPEGGVLPQNEPKKVLSETEEM